MYVNLIILFQYLRRFIGKIVITSFSYNKYGWLFMTLQLRSILLLTKRNRLTS